MGRSNGLYMATGMLALAAAAAFAVWWWSPALPAWVTAAFRVLQPTTALEVEAAAPLQTAAQVAPTAIPTPPVAAAPFCAPGVQPQFQLGFATLNERLPGVMGKAVECEHAEDGTGNVVQATTRGLAVFEKDSGRLRFTDGYNHWAIVGDEVRTWAGDEPAPAVAGAQAERAKVANTDGLGVRLRREPSTSAASLGAIMEGVAVTIVERSGTYAKVRAPDNREGWVPGQYLRAE